MTRGEKVCQFIEKFCPVPEGKLVGQPIKLMPFQRNFILDRFTTTQKEQVEDIYPSGRKNGKSALIAAILLAHLVGPEAQAEQPDQ